MDNYVNYDPNTSIQVVFQNINTQDHQYTIPSSAIAPVPTASQFATVVDQLIVIANSEEFKNDGYQHAAGGSQEMSFEQVLDRDHQADGDEQSPDGDQQAGGGQEISDQSPEVVATDDGESSIRPTIVCDKCGRIFHSQSGYKAHVDVVHNKLLCKCNICGATMKYDSNLRAHMRIVHKIGEPKRKITFNRVCPKCKKKFNSNYAMYHHLQTVHGVDKPHKCNVCQAHFRRLCDLIGHETVHPELAPYACDYCPYRYKTKLSLEKHKKKFGHNGMCGTFQQPTPNEFDCKKCKKVFASMQGYVYHMNNFKGICSQNDGRHMCKCCGEVFEKQSEVKIHFHENHQEYVNALIPVRKKEGGKPRNIGDCKKCKKVFATKLGYVCHMNNFEGMCNQNDDRHMCKCCGEVFEKQSEVKIHFNENHQEYVYVPKKGDGKPCPVCKKMLFKSSNFKYHAKLHSGIKPYKCDLCQYSTILPKDLAKHKQHVHEKAKNHQCEICCRNFFVRNDRIAHHDFHLGIKRFKCSICHKPYRTQSSCYKHQKLCTIGKGQTANTLNPKDVIGFRCRWCGAVFSLSSGYTAHRKLCDLKGNMVDFQVPERQVLEKALDDILLQDNNAKYSEQYHDGDLIRPDLLPWCKICGGLFVKWSTCKDHSYFCTTEKKKRRDQKDIPDMNNDQGGNEDKEQIIKQTITLAVPEPDQSVNNPKQDQPKPHKYVLILKPKRKQSVLKKPRVGQPVLNKPQAGQSILSKPQAEQYVLGKPQEKQFVLSKPQTEQSVLSKPQTEQSVLSEPQTEQSVLDRRQAEQSVLDRRQVEQSVHSKPQAKLFVLDKPETVQDVLDEQQCFIDNPQAEQFNPQAVQFVLDESQAEQFVLAKPQPEQSVISTTQTKNSSATHKVFSPFSYICGVCRDVTEELIKEFCSEHYTFCTYCRNVVKFDANARIHLQGHLMKQEKPQCDDQLVCKTCRKTTEELIQAHIRRHPYHCLKCLLAFDSIKKLGKHAKEHNVERGNFPCNQCDSIFNQKSKLDVHVRQCHLQDLVFIDNGKIKYKLVCQYCPAKFKTKIERNLHEQSAHDHGTVYKCCGTDFNTLDKYKKHQTSKRHIRFVNRCVINKPSARGELSDSEDVEMNTDD